MKIVIAGSGIMGLFSAYYLSRKGCEVVLLEKGDGPGGASLGNSGMIVPSHFTPLAAPGVMKQSIKWLLKQNSPLSIKPRIDLDLFSWGWKFIRSSNSGIKEKRELLYKLNCESRELYQTLITDEELLVDFKAKGLIMYCKTEKSLREESEIIPLAHALGQEAVLLNATEAQSLDPGLQLDVLGGVYYPGDAFLSPHLLINQLYDLLQKQGVEILSNTPLTSIEVKKGKIVGFISNDAKITGDEYVIATGAWSQNWTHNLGLKVPIEAGKGYSFTLGDPKQLPEICSILVEARVAVTPMGSSLRFGGTMELAGLDPRINSEKVAGIQHSIPAYFPQFQNKDFRDMDIWSGYRPCSPDGLPYIGKSSAIDNLTIATGHAMMGLSLGPVTGKIVSDVILKDIKISPLLSVDRFA